MPTTVQSSSARRGSGAMRSVIGPSLASLLVLVLSAGVLWLVWIYGTGLRDPRYLDGWVLAAGMVFQLYYHAVIAAGRLSPRLAVRRRRFHIYAGYLLIPIFLSHAQFSLPDSGFEWALWAGFVLVSLSGIFGALLAWLLKARRRADDDIAYERIPDLRAGLSGEVLSVVNWVDPSHAQLPLPGLPHDDWIADLYTAHLRDFFARRHNTAIHLVGSKRPLKQLLEEIDSVSTYVGAHGQEKLAAIKSLVIEKDRLDALQVYLGLNRGWLMVHVPVTYALIVLSVMHVLVVYAFSSGAW